MVRLFIQKMNEMIKVHNDGIETLYEEAGTEVTNGVFVDPITYEGVNELFLAFDAFKQRPDFREHMRLWYMGGDLSTLPEVKEEDEESAPEEEYPEGAQIFGGDYGSQVRDETTEGDSEESDGGEVSEVSGEDDHEDPAGDTEASAAVP